MACGYTYVLMSRLREMLRRLLLVTAEACVVFMPGP